MSWFKAEDTAHDHPKFGKLARTLGVDWVVACGHIWSLWTWVVRHAPDGNLESFDAEDVAAAARWAGDPDVFVGAMIKCRLLDTYNGSNSLIVHGWMERAGSYKVAQRKARSRDRVETGSRQGRDSHAQRRGEDIEERRGEEKRSMSRSQLELKPHTELLTDESEAICTQSPQTAPAVGNIPGHATEGNPYAELSSKDSLVLAALTPGNDGHEGRCPPVPPAESNPRVATPASVRRAAGKNGHKGNPYVVAPTEGKLYTALSAKGNAHVENRACKSDRQGNRYVVSPTEGNAGVASPTGERSPVKNQACKVGREDKRRHENQDRVSCGVGGPTECTPYEGERGAEVPAGGKRIWGGVGDTNTLSRNSSCPPGQLTQIKGIISTYTHYHPRAHPGKKERDKIRDRLREGYTPADLIAAIHGCHKSAHHCGNNDRGTKYQSLALIMRDSSQVSSFIEHSQGKAKRPMHPSHTPHGYARPPDGETAHRVTPSVDSSRTDVPAPRAPATKNPRNKNQDVPKHDTRDHARNGDEARKIISMLSRGMKIPEAAKEVIG